MTLLVTNSLLRGLSKRWMLSYLAAFVHRCDFPLFIDPLHTVHSLITPLTFLVSNEGNPTDLLGNLWPRDANLDAAILHMVQEHLLLLFLHARCTFLTFSNSVINGV